MSLVTNVIRVQNGKHVAYFLLENDGVARALEARRDDPKLRNAQIRPMQMSEDNLRLLATADGRVLER